MVMDIPPSIDLFHDRVYLEMLDWMLVNDLQANSPDLNVELD